ncbi:hypothetical protein ACFXPS_43945 [Nocardia sp. NPDC059091]|uniref:hypothetical protein n=1 Tax=unclassified Nocardia TaxID=2637762 RepID=UPI003675DD42
MKRDEIIEAGDATVPSGEPLAALDHGADRGHWEPHMAGQRTREVVVSLTCDKSNAGHTSPIGIGHQSEPLLTSGEDHPPGNRAYERT